MSQEVSQTRLAETYSRTAAFYDEVVAQHQARAKEIALELVAWRQEERLLEVGIGTGWLLEKLLGEEKAGRLVGLDVAEGMLQVARDRLSAARYEAPALVLGDATSLSFPDESFDAVLCTYTLEVLPTKAVSTGLAEMRRVLRPGGRIVVADLTDGEGEDAAFTEDWNRRYQVDPDYFGGARPIVLTPLLRVAGFEVIERRYSGHDAGWPTEILLAKPAYID